MKLGLRRTIKIGFSLLRSSLFPVKPEKNLEEFFINRFGRELYRTFFKSYTEKVWGVPCDEISAEWGAQRIKGLSITKAVLHALKKLYAQQSRHRAEDDRDLAHRAVPLPEVRPRADVGRGRTERSRARRRDPDAAPRGRKCITDGKSRASLSS